MKKIDAMSELCYFENHRDDISFVFSETCIACDYFRYLILDKENAIVEKIVDDKTCRISHLRIIDGWLTEINSLDLPNNLKSEYGYTVHPIGDSGICLIERTLGSIFSKACSALYDFKNAEFIVKPGIWAYINNYNECIKRHNGLLAGFTLCSKVLDDESLTYPDIFTGGQTHYFFNSDFETYFAILNYDGTIRGNKIFKGNAINSVTEIIDLSEYGSVEKFKEHRLLILEEQKQEKIRQYKEFIANRSSISPYFDNEVLSIISNQNVETGRK